MAKLIITIEHTQKENDGHVSGQSTYYPDVSMTFQVPSGSGRQDYIKAYAAFMYHVFGYSIKELEEIYQE